MALLIQIVVNMIVPAPVLWISGRLLVSEDEAKFIDAVWIVVLGVVLGAIVNWNTGAFIFYFRNIKQPFILGLAHIYFTLK